MGFQYSILISAHFFSIKIFERNEITFTFLPVFKTIEIEKRVIKTISSSTVTFKKIVVYISIMKTYFTSKADLQNQPSRGIQLIYEVTSPQVFSLRKGDFQIVLSVFLQKSTFSLILEYFFSFFCLINIHACCNQ